MRRHAIATVMLSLTLGTITLAADEVGRIDYCRDVSLIGKDIMMARQNNVPMSETLPISIGQLMDLANERGVDPGRDEIEKVAADLVMAAYEVPYYSFEANRQEVVSEFENTLFRECYKSAASNAEEIEQQRTEHGRLRKADEPAPQAESQAEMGAYMFAIQQRIQRNWVRPPTAKAGIECEVNIRQLPSGEVVSTSIGACNADSAVRQSIESAVRKSSPLPIPSDPSIFNRDIRLIFIPEE